MFLRRIQADVLTPDGQAKPAPLAHIDSFCMRNFTNDALFDDTLPLADGLLEIGSRVPLDRLETAMQEWFQRKGYLKPAHHLRLTELR